MRRWGAGGNAGVQTEPKPVQASVQGPSGYGASANPAGQNSWMARPPPTTPAAPYGAAGNASPYGASAPPSGQNNDPGVSPRACDESLGGLCAEMRSCPINAIQRLDQAQKVQQVSCATRDNPSSWRLSNHMIFASLNAVASLAQRRRQLHTSSTRSFATTWSTSSSSSAKCGWSSSG